MYLIMKKAMRKWSLILYMSFWGGGGDSATTAPACARAFRQGPAFPAQCSSPALGSTRSCTLHPRTLQCFTEPCEHHPSPRGCDPGTQRLRSKLCQLVSETWFWPLWEVLSISTAGQSPLRSCRCSAPLARSPRAGCAPCQRPGWEEASQLNVPLKGSTASQWQRMTTTPFLSLCS